MKKLLLISLGIIFSIVTNAQIIADFEVTPPAGCSPLLVKFTDKSTGTGPFTYKWDFGNGNTSDIKNPQASYSQPGEYIVSLVVSDGILSDTIIKDKAVKVYLPPIPDLKIVSLNKGCVPIDIEFQDLSKQTDGKIIKWLWDFGDGFTGSEQNPKHTYKSGGNFPVSLQVVDENGCQSARYLAGYVNAFSLPEIDFTALPTFICAPPLIVNFSNRTTVSQSVSYEWNFGDNSVSTEINPSHTYQYNGNYTITLKAKDVNGCTNFLSKKDFIQLDAVITSFSIPRDTVCIGENIPFNNQTQRASEYNWNFGDGRTSNTGFPQITFNQGGSYRVVLTASRGPNCVHQYVKNIFVATVSAKFSSNPNYSCSVPFLVNFTDQSTNAAKWEWRFGNGQVSYLKNPVITYNQTTNLSNNSLEVYGTYLKVTSRHGCESTFKIDSNITIALPVAYFTPNYYVEPLKLSGCIPLSVKFEDKSIFKSPIESITSRTWSSGDGQTSVQANPEYIYRKDGKYDVVLSINTTKGCNSKYTVQIAAGFPQNPDFTIDGPTTYCASEGVKFTDLSKDSRLINSWSWLFGDNLGDIRKDPTHFFVDTGYLGATLRVGYNGCYQSISKQNIVKILPAYATFTYSFQCKEPFKYAFQSNFKGVDQFTWDFGDGQATDSENKNPVHIFPKTGDFIVKLSTKNNKTGCSYVYQLMIRVREIKSRFKADKILGCPGMTVNFDASPSRDKFFFSYNQQYAQYLWNFGDGQEIFTVDSLISHKFEQRGSYKVRLVVSDLNGCRDTSYTLVRVFQTRVDFVAEKYTGCLPVKVDFSNKSISDTSIISWQWDYGDGTTSNQFVNYHVYNNFGVYTLSLKAKDAIGCEGQLVKGNYVEVLNPIPDFAVSDSALCVGDSVRFYLTKFQDDILFYSWKFGADMVSKNEKPVIKFNRAGEYNASVTVTDLRGCDSAAYIEKYVKVQDYPKTDLIADITKSNCYPLLVNFYDNSTTNSPITKWKWAFGDGKSSSTLKQPEHNYVIPGFYNISLINYTSNGCADTVSKPKYIDVGGPYAEIIANDSSCKGINVRFITKSKINVYDFKWDFGDGQIGTGDTAVHVYMKYGKVKPSLLLYSDNSHTCDKFIKDSIYLYELIPSYSVDYEKGCVPLALNIQDKSTGSISWHWDLGDNSSSDLQNISYTYNQPGLYHLVQIVKDQHGCSDTIEKVISVFPLPVVSINKDTLICWGTEAHLYASGGTEYKWTPVNSLDNAKLFNPVAKPDKTTTYTVIVTDINGCISQKSNVVTVQEVPQIVISRDTSVVIGEKIPLYSQSQKGASFEWQPDKDISCTRCQTPISTTLDPVTYILTVSDSIKCFRVSKSVSIDIMRKYSVDVPQAFSPNQDGINDILFVRGWGIRKLIDFKIYNRFGELVFQTDNLSQGWDGNFKGVKQNIETYLYMVKVETYDGDILTKTGNFMILR